MSYIGEPIEAPHGYGPLSKGCVYYFLGSIQSPDDPRDNGEEGKDAARALVALASFESNPPRAFLHKISCEEFETGIASLHIRALDNPPSLPPWHHALEGRDLSKLDGAIPPARGKKRKLTYEERVDRRLGSIRPLTKQVREILSSDDPEQVVARFARKSAPPLNERRAWLWFLVYIAFQRNKWALLPTYFGRVGTWNRLTRRAIAKSGRHAAAGRRAGYPRCQEFVDGIMKGWERFHGRGVYLTVIILRTLIEIFGCRIRTSARGRKEFYHPQGKPFPSEWQSRYELIKQIGREKLQLALYGEVRTRVRKRGSKGRFTEMVVNLLQHITGDGYYVDEVPVGPIDGKPMPPLLVVRLRCLLSGALVGIGFGIGSERGEAYRMALFCMAAPKVMFCALFGLPIKPEDWPCLGVPSWFTTDRGPGSSAEFVNEFEDHIPIHEITPSWQGQSNAPIESTHPRKLKPSGKPQYRLSGHDYVALARREIERLIRDNQSIDMTEHMTPNMLKAGVLAVPLGLWNYFDARRRTDAHYLPLHIAIPSLLKKVQFDAHEDGVYLHGQRYTSDDLRESGFTDRVITAGIFPVTGYVVELAVRRAWIELKDRLISVEAMLPHIDDEGQLFFSLPELEQLGSLRNRARTEQRGHRLAAHAESRLRFKEHVGKDWDAGTTRNGRAKRGTTQAKKEFSDVKRTLKGGARG